MISGQIADGGSVKTFELLRDDGAWTSGRVTLLNGTFMTRVMLEAGARNTFHVQAYDQQGTQVPVSPASFTITHGLDVAPPTCPMSYKLPVQDGYSTQMRVDTLIEKGRPLPCSETHDYRTAKAVSAGSKEDIIRIPIVEGEYDTLDFNCHVGTVLIEGNAISRNLPEGSEVHVTLHVNENGIPSVDAYVPFLERRFGTILTNRAMQHVDYQGLVNNLAEDESRVLLIAEELEKDAMTPASHIELKQNAAHVQSEIIELQNALPSGNQTTEEDLQKIERQRKALAEKINALASALEIPRSVAALQDAIGWAHDIVETHGTPDDVVLFEDYQQEAMRAIDAGSLVLIQRVRSEVNSIAWRILYRIDDFWIGTFQDMCQHVARFSNPQQAQTLIHIGRQALARQDVEELRKVVWQLWDLYPETDRLEASRRFETDLRMA
jgi:molecular chaperone DnaK